MTTVAQVLSTRPPAADDGARHFIARVEQVAGRLATVALLPSGAVTTAYIPLDINGVAPGSTVLVIAHHTANVVLARLEATP